MFGRIRSSIDRKRRSRRKNSAGSSMMANDEAIIIKDESTPAVIENLVAVVEANKERLFLGEARLSLTPSSLLTVNTAFNKYQADVRLQQDGSLSSHDSGINGLLSRNRSGLTSTSSDEIEFRVDTYVIRARKSDVNILQQVMAKTKSLKISHGADTILGRIRLAPLFRELSVLELKRIPIHLVCGLSQLRSTLTSLSAIRSLASLEEIFVKCGGDAAEPQSWVCLKSVNLGWNGIVRLDPSLRLLPKLELLDVSHNLLTSTEHFLEYLPELRLLNLSYNRIEHFPSLSYSARRRLTVLSLRGNNLDHLNGLDVLTDLVELDVRDNCICEMRSLEPLSQLHMLQSVAFLGNPIAFMKDYRNVALQFISRRAAFDRQIIFDGQKLTQKETAFLPHHPPRLLSKTTLGDSSENILTLSLPIDGTRSGRTPLAERARKRGKNSSRRPRLARDAVITDIEDTETPYETEADTTTDGEAMLSGFSSLSHDEVTENSGVESDVPRRSQSQKRQTDLEDIDINEMKAKVEELRLSRGHEWLHEWPGIVQSNQLDDSAPDAKTNTQSVSEDATTGPSTNALLSMSPSSAVDWADAVAKNDDTEKRDEGVEVEREEKQEEEDVFEEESDEEKVVVAPSKDYGIELNSFIVSNDCQSASTCPFCIDEDNSNSEDKSRVDRLRFLSVSAKFIVEKDLDGDVREEMEFSCLVSKEVIDHPNELSPPPTTSCKEDEDGEDENGNGEQSTPDEPTSALPTEEDEVSASEPGHFHPSVRLRFSYIRKDRRLRHYWFEDADSCASFVDLLDSLVKRKATDSNTIHQCLRCSHEFLWQKSDNRASLALTRASRRQAVEKALSSGPPRACPQCQSPLIVELEANPDGEEAQVAAPLDLNGAVATEETAVDAKPNSVADLGGEAGEVARISWIERPVSIEKEVCVEQSPVVSEPPLANASSDSSIAIISSDCNIQHDIPASTSPSSTTQSGSAVYSTMSTSTPMKASGSLLIVTADMKDPSPQLSSSGSIAPVLEEDEERDRVRGTLFSSPGNGDGADPEDEEIAGSVESGKMLTPAGSFVDGFAAAASLTKTVFQNMAASVIASSLGNSPSLSAGTFDSNYADAISGSPVKRVKDHPIDAATSEQQQQLQQQQQQPGTPQLRREESFAVGFTFEPLSFSAVDHRLSLYFDLVLFGDDEEFVSLLCTDLVASGNPPAKEDGSIDVYATQQFLVVTSSIRIYFLKVTGEMEGQPDTWLSLVDDLPLTSLAYLDWGLGLLSFRLEFVNHNPPNQQDSSDQLGSSYCVIIRDEKRCMKYVRGLIDQVKRSTSSPLSQLKSISKQQHPDSLQNLIQALGKSDSQDDVVNDAQELSFKYFLALDLSSSFCPNTLVVVDSDIHIIDENFHHPPPRDLPPPSKQILDVPQFLVKRTINVTEVSSISLLGLTTKKDSPQELASCRLSYFDETEPSEFGFESQEALDALVKTVATLWEEDFGVELEILREEKIY